MFLIRYKDLNIYQYLLELNENFFICAKYYYSDFLVILFSLKSQFIGK